ncbi:hypothetical protein V1478_002483 [Vespula squamosa]|uniref:Uncharacterized protein n=1 Tax=Vespula squamosa TaxID=30214 RepID=A0ABD2BSP4_VESSQ
MVLLGSCVLEKRVPILAINVLVYEDIRGMTFKHKLRAVIFDHYNRSDRPKYRISAALRISAYKGRVFGYFKRAVGWPDRSIGQSDVCSGSFVSSGESPSNCQVDRLFLTSLIDGSQDRSIVERSVFRGGLRPPSIPPSTSPRQYRTPNERIVNY